MAFKKIKADISYNIVSYAFIGISGLLINIIIASYYSSEILGLFNLYYALFIILSQLVGAGIHFSVLKYASHHADNRELKDILLNGLLATAFNAIIWLSIIYMTRTLFRSLFTKNEYLDLFHFLIPALFFFVLNKVFLSFRNAKKQMKYFAFFSAFRPCLMVLALVLLVILKKKEEECVSIFLYSEFVLFLFLLFTTIKELYRAKFSKSWIILHFNHGYKSAIGSVMIDVNTRVDVIMLGYFMNERIVGIYSFASMIADGFNQLPVVLRTIINPYLTEGFFNENNEELRKKILIGRNMTYKTLIPIGIMLIVLYLPALKVLGFYDEYSGSVWPFTILLLGTLVSIGYAPFLMVFNQTGYPMTQSFLYFMIFISNLALNFILIPYFGINGAALATAISYSMIVIYIKMLAAKKLLIKI